ncbi:hypothetical protein B0H14DRAFT_3449358 [Mycena olivaceomarginata]|nr:hypothetical protein B0H14DRAFT_3449358 [Mycena olivaceomarginata]
MPYNLREGFELLLQHPCLAFEQAQPCNRVYRDDPMLRLSLRIHGRDHAGYSPVLAFLAFIVALSESLAGWPRQWPSDFPRGGDPELCPKPQAFGLRGSAWCPTHAARATHLWLARTKMLPVVGNAAAVWSPTRPARPPSAMIPPPRSELLIAVNSRK